MRPRPFSSRVAARAVRLLGGETGAGVLLMVVAALAMVAANSNLAPLYHDLFHGVLGWTPVAKLDTLHLWINDALMAIFFFVVGLEIKREVVDGDLSTPARRRLPVFAAAMGMVFPAGVYLAIAGSAQPLSNGWAIPAATDIAFALGVLGLVGKRVPPSLRLFLLTVAIVDDLGAVAIIALFYTSSIKLAWLAGALAIWLAMAAANRLKLSRAAPYLLLSLALWYCVLHSGVHATIAGVAAALVIPMRLDRHGDSPLLRMEHALVPLNGYVIVPLFGFANAGVTLTGLGQHGAAAALPIAIGAGLVVGKQAGILAALIIARATGFAALPKGASWPQLWGTALLCGIGFTMSLFITALAFPAHPELAEAARIGVMGGSLLSAVAGFLLLRLAPRPSV